MSVLINLDTKVLCQGITGYRGSFFCHRAIEYGTKIVGGVVPGRGGQKHLNLPVYDTVAEARDATDATVSVLFVPPQAVQSAVMEAIDARLELLVCITEGVPIFDMLRIRERLAQSKTRMIGPNCPGIIVPGKCNIGIIPSSIYQPGDIGMVSRSGTLLYEAVAQLCRHGLGQSACIGIGADALPGTSFTDCLRLFKDDDETKAVLLIGEIGGGAEEEAAEYLLIEQYPKPVIAYVAGRSAPQYRRMGHSGAIISSGLGATNHKIDALRKAGAIIVESPVEFGETVRRTVRN